MDPLAGLDDDEHADFFRRDEAEPESQSLAAFEVDASEPPPSDAQLAHFKRFQKPVGWFLGGMALLSLAGLALHSAAPAPFTPVASASPHAARKLVAHYGAAIPAAPAAPLVDAARLAPYEPVAWGAFSPAPLMCLLDPSADSVWLTVALAEPANEEGTAARLSHVSSARARRPTATSNLGAHVTTSAHFAPSARFASVPAPPMAAPAIAAPAVAAPAIAAPAAPTPPPFRSVARFPDPR